MKRKWNLLWRRCPLLVLLVVSALLIGLIGLGLQSRLPERRRADGLKTPYLTGTFLYLSGERRVPASQSHALPDKRVRMLEPAITKPSDYQKPVPVETAVDDSYFDDALFIGDSRIDDMHSFSGLNNATYYAKTGMSVYRLFKDPFIELDGESVTLEEALSRRQFGKIYLMLGMNEFGSGTEQRFIDTYQEAVARIRALQPNAIFYVMGSLSATRSLADHDEYVTLDAIKTRNADLASLADGEHIFYLDVNEEFADAEGYLDPKYADGDSHLKGKYYRQWADFIRAHAIVFQMPQS